MLLWLFFILPLALGDQELSRQIRNPHVSHKIELVVSHPLQDVPISSCPFCNVDRCSPLDFCYIIKNRHFGTTSGEYCGSFTDLTTVIRDKLVNRMTNNACQPGIADLNSAYCWCQNTSSGDTMEEQLRRVRIWRYAPLKWHADRELMLSSAAPVSLSILLLLVF